MKTHSTASPKIALGPICLCLLMFVTACAESRVLVRTKYVPVTRPEAFSSDCLIPKERPLEKTGELPRALKEVEAALGDCAAQVRIGREYDEEVVKEVTKLNKQRETSK